MNDLIILVDENDRELGVMEKMEAHLKGHLHRAFSVFIFNENGDMLLQKRASSKYHSGGLWTNTCCSHPRPNESLTDAANRRLMEEMGMECELQHKFSFIYKCGLDNNLMEHELDHVFTGVTNMIPVLNRDEVEDYRYLSKEELKKEIADSPHLFTEWFKIALPKLLIQ